ncbi:helix-turn-helix domain-containing protein [Frankia gtarii]|uniref:helix-turn-helix domain-containing protein n=1 Tax=Frankia gtarii TaxID=2950102 RepID=UPI0021C003C2|nr:helix-turn-helix domain-containing protein [Frankia gtarii]
MSTESNGRPGRAHLRPVEAGDQDRVRRLHAGGASRNAIAREIGRSPATVTKIAKGLGLKFDRSATREATAAKVVDAAARRTELVGEMLVEASRLVRRLSEPFDSVFASKDGESVVTPLAQVTPAAARDLASAVASLSASIARLSTIPVSDSTSEARSMLGDLARALGVAAAGMSDAS